jgi:hypothetical protein
MALSTPAGASPRRPYPSRTTISVLPVPVVCDNAHCDGRVRRADSAQPQFGVDTLQLVVVRLDMVAFQKGHESLLEQSAVRPGKPALGKRVWLICSLRHAIGISGTARLRQNRACFSSTFTVIYIPGPRNILFAGCLTRSFLLHSLWIRSTQNQQPQTRHLVSAS